VKIDFGKSAWRTAKKLMLEKVPGDVHGKLMLGKSAWQTT